jgi:hypothetical protein
VAFSAASAVTTAVSGDVTPALPAGWAADDIFLCWIRSKDNVNSTMPAGWTAIDAGTNNGTLLRTSLFYRRAVVTSGDPPPHGSRRQSTTVTWRLLAVNKPGLQRIFIPVHLRRLSGRTFLVFKWRILCNRLLAPHVQGGPLYQLPR